MNSIINCQFLITKRKLTTKKDYWCFGRWKIQLSLKKYLQASSPSHHVNSVCKIQILLHVDHKMEQFLSMILEKRVIVPLPKTDNLWINTLTQFGIFNGSQKVKEERDKLSYQSVLMGVLQNGQWKKDFNVMIWCFWEDYLKTIKNKTFKIWTLDLPVVYLSSSWKVNLRCIWQLLKKV